MIRPPKLFTNAIESMTIPQKNMMIGTDRMTSVREKIGKQLEEYSLHRDGFNFCKARFLDASHQTQQGPIARA